MSFFKKVIGELKEVTQQSLDNHFRFEREALMDEFCQHLRFIGINAMLLEPDSPEAFRYPPYILGHVKIESRNIDAILVQYSSSGGGDSEGGPDEAMAHYRYFYVVRANIDGLESKLKADFKSSWHDRCSQKRNFSWINTIPLDGNVSDCRWEGGELAQLLNTDSELSQTLYSQGLDRLEIRSDRSRRCVRIEHWHWKVYSGKDSGPGDLKNKYDHRVATGTYISSIGRKQFPTREAFEAYDRIAYAIKAIVKAESK